MFKDYETRYVIASVAMVVLFTCVAAWYETDYREADSLSETVAAIFQWLSPAIALTITILAVWEVFMVLADRLRAKRYEEGRQEGLREGRQDANAEWEQWIRERDNALRNNLPFNTPSPSERENNKPSPGDAGH